MNSCVLSTISLNSLSGIVVLDTNSADAVVVVVGLVSCKEAGLFPLFSWHVVVSIFLLSSGTTTTEQDHGEEEANERCPGETVGVAAEVSIDSCVAEVVTGLYCPGTVILR